MDPRLIRFWQTIHFLGWTQQISRRSPTTFSKFAPSTMKDLGTTARKSASKQRKKVCWWRHPSFISFSPELTSRCLGSRVTPFRLRSLSQQCKKCFLAMEIFAVISHVYISAPGAPSNFSVTDITTSSVELSWKRPQRTNGMIRHYVLNYTSGNEQWTTVNVGKSPKYTVEVYTRIRPRTQTPVASYQRLSSWYQQIPCQRLGL